MYFVVSWDISASDHTWTVMNERMLNCIAKYNPVRPVYTFYMVKVSSQAQYEEIFKALMAIAENSKQPEVHFVMSPLLTVTDWRGWTNDPYWNQIRRLAS